ncbi:MAG: START domain-containing protein [Candidatus Omnitrophica bacterium]|nr:START domain-containing protein [Candidatus Omnitrophota bacterium]
MKNVIQYKFFHIRTAMFLIAAVIGVCFYASTLQAAEYPWQLRVDKQGIKVYTRKVDASPILEFKADVVVDAPISKVIPLFEDVETARLWFYQCTQSNVVAREGSQQKAVYIILRLPWPVSARDCVFRMSKSVDTVTGALTYALVAIPDRVSRKPGIVRVPYLRAFWHFLSLPDGRTKIDFQQHSDPGGFIPAFLSNTIVVDMPYNSLKNLRALIMASKTRK